MPVPALRRLAHRGMLLLLPLTVCVLAGPAPAKTASPEVVRLWPGQAPGTESWTGEEIERPDPKNPFGTITVTTNVTVPTLTVFRPAPGKANGTAMVVLPGGAFQILAWDIEGTEVARWLTERGVTAFLLKYRARTIKPEPGQPMPTTLDGFLKMLKPGRRIAMDDAAQAMRIVRGNAARYGVRPDRIGMVGFSAGAITTIGLILEGDPAVRPNFAAPIYGALLMDLPKVPEDAPPLFLAAAQDDPLVSGSIDIYKLWSDAKRPAELHLYEKGSHGFGMRANTLPVGRWPDAFEAWMAQHDYLPRMSAATR